ncbi:hypothetical protein CMK18_23190 [Candidatus Poribacteria bacterium]|nr:hypothetical protein [Candidatus Poribacteria bacterium]
MMSEKKSEVEETNPVWARFCQVQIEGWLEWVTSIHVNSYLEMADRFIALNPYYVPDTEHDRTPLFDQLMINDEFLSSLSDVGLSVWANSNFRDFLVALRPYGKVDKQLQYVVDFFDSQVAWFSRVYQFVRASAIKGLREEGRQI